MAAYRPIEAWRPLLFESPEELRKTCDLWLRTSNSISFFARYHPEEFIVRELPTGYRELTSVLVWWCDAGPYSIDPQHLMDQLTAANLIAFFSRLKNAEAVARGVGDFSLAYVKAKSVLNRMQYAAFASIGVMFKEPDDAVPPEYQSRPKSKAEFARIHYGKKHPNPAQYLKRQNIVLMGKPNSKIWIADLRQWPEFMHEALLK